MGVCGTRWHVTPFSTGAAITTDQANFDGSFLYGGSAEGHYRKRTVEVGSFKPNPFGLHDMHGNVWEWVEDCYHENYNGAPTDGSEWYSSCIPHRVIRGGSYSFHPAMLRSAYRFVNPPDGRIDDRGFRKLARQFLDHFLYVLEMTATLQAWFTGTP